MPDTTVKLPVAAAEIIETPDAKFYTIRQARTRIIGSPVQTRSEAEREAAVWAEEIGPAVVVPATPELAHATRVYDQEVLGEILYPAVPPVLTPAQARILAEVTASGYRVYGGRARPQIARLGTLGLVDAPRLAGSRITVTLAAPCRHQRRRCVAAGCLCCCRPCTDRRNTP
jgi:hypothetical protein